MNNYVLLCHDDYLVWRLILYSDTIVHVGKGVNTIAVSYILLQDNILLSLLDLLCFQIFASLHLNLFVCDREPLGAVILPVCF